MLFHLNNLSKANFDKLLAFAKQNQLQLSLVDNAEDNLLFPGNQLSASQLSAMIEKSRKSGMVSMTKAHQLILNHY